jgi:hypothetical protein
LTSDLEHRVHRLAISLDQRIYRLERIRDLITGLMHVTYALRQENRSTQDKLDVAIKLNMTMPELEALISVINDSYLQTLFQQLKATLTDELWPLTWNRMPYDMGSVDQLLVQQSDCTRQMHQRILLLVEEVASLDETGNGINR